MSHSVLNDPCEVCGSAWHMGLNDPLKECVVNVLYWNYRGTWYLAPILWFIWSLRFAQGTPTLRPACFRAPDRLRSSSTLGFVLAMPLSHVIPREGSRPQIRIAWPATITINLCMICQSPSCICTWTVRNIIA